MAVGVELPVSLHLLLQPDIFLHELLVPTLALLEVVELCGSTEVGFWDVTALFSVAIEYTHITQ